MDDWSTETRERNYACVNGENRFPVYERPTCPYLGVAYYRIRSLDATNSIPFKSGLAHDTVIL